MGKVTKNQTVLLFVMLWVLVVVVLVMYVFIPKFDEMEEAEEQIEYSEEQYNTMIVDAAMLEAYKADSENLEAEIVEKLVPYYVYKKNSELDHEILEIAAKNGCEASGVDISDPVYIEYFDGFNDLTDGYGGKTSSGSSVSVEDNYEEFYSGEGSEGGEGEYSDEVFIEDSATEKVPDLSGFWVVQTEYSITASYQQILSFIKDINAHDSLYFGSVSLQQMDDGTEDDDDAADGAFLPSATPRASLGDSLEFKVTINVVMHPEQM